MNMQAVYTTKSPNETIELGRKLAGRLKGGDTVLLYGELGAGKTHFIKGVAAGLGVKDVVKSPTYAYVNQYSLRGGLTLHHYDLYRLNEGDNITSIGLSESVSDLNAINIIEWADLLGDQLPERYVRVELESGGNDERTIAIEFVSPATLDEDQIGMYYDEWVTPMHVREHCRLVAQVAMQVAEAHVKRGEIVNMNLLYPAAMLHDVNRVCDFKELDRSRFTEEVTDDKWEKWQAFREQFKGRHHADITAGILLERGFTETAEVIRLHKSTNIVLEPDSYDTLERQIVFYADKRVAHDKIVSLAERFEDGKQRYAKYDNPEKRKLFDEVEKRTYELEKRLL